MTGMGVTVRDHKQTHLDLEQVLIVLFAAAAGATSPTSVVYRTAASAARAAGAPATSASALSWTFNNPLFFVLLHFAGYRGVAPVR